MPLWHGLANLPLGEAASRTNGRHRAEAHSCIATLLLESMITETNNKAPNNSEHCLTPMVFGNADPYAVLAALAATTGDYEFPKDIDYNQSKDSLMVYYLDWKKAEISAQVPKNLSDKSEEAGFNHLPFYHTAFHYTEEGWLDVRTIGKVGNRAHHLQCSDLLFKPTDTTCKTPLIIHLKYAAEEGFNNLSDEAIQKRRQERWERLPNTSAFSSGTAFRATAAASFFGTANAASAVITVKENLLSPWIQRLLIAALAAIILVMMPPTRHGHGRSRNQGQGGPPLQPRANYCPLDPPQGEGNRDNRETVPSGGYGRIEYIETSHALIVSELYRILHTKDDIVSVTTLQEPMGRHKMCHRLRRQKQKPQ